MNRLVYALPLLLILVAGVSSAYAEIFELEIDVENERVTISGNTQTSSELFLTIWNDSDDIAFEQIWVSGLDGEFYNSVGLNDLKEYGIFTGELKHDGGIEQFSFEIMRNIPTLDLQIDDSGEIQLVPQSAYEELSQQNERLRLENEELKNEIEELKNEIFRMQESFFLQIKSQLNYFLSLSNN